MTIRRIDPSRGSSQGCREASTAADVRGASEGAKKKKKDKKKDRSPAPDLGSDGGDVSGGEIARLKQRRKQKKNKKKDRSPAPGLGSDRGDVAGGEIARPKQRRKQRRSTSPVSDGGPLLGTDEPKISDSRTSRCRSEEAKESSAVVTLPLETNPDIQSPPTSVDFGNIARQNAEQLDKLPNVIHHKQEKGPEEIEGLNWDDSKLGEEIQSCLDLFTSDLPSRDNENFWYYRDDDEQLKSLNERLALHRIRAHRILMKGAKLEELKDAELMKEYTSEVLENEEYFVSFEWDFEWYFEPEYTEHAGFQDYQRLVLRDTGDYLEWSYYHQTLSTYEGDQEYVDFYENLSSKAEWIVKSLGVNWSEWSSYQRLAFYHALKNAESYPNIFISLIFAGFHEYIWSAAFDNLTCKGISDLYFELWKRVAKGKMGFIEALEQVNDLGICADRCLDIKIELEYKPGSGGMRHKYETYISGIDEEVKEDEARTLIMDAVKKFTRKPKMYYDYAKKKLGIARENGIIPPKVSKSSTIQMDSEKEDKTALRIELLRIGTARDANFATYGQTIMQLN